MNAPHSDPLLGCLRVHRQTDPLQLPLRLQSLDHPIAKVLLKCATSTNGFRCQQTLICGRCAPRASRKHRRSIERDLRALPIGTRTALVTLTVNAPDIETGRRALLAAFRAVRRQDAWKRAIVSGRGQIEVKPSVSGGWHVHAHVVATLRRRVRVDTWALASAWHRLLNGLPGGVDVRRIPMRFADGRRTFLARRVLRHEARSIGVAVADGSRARRDGRCAARATVGRELRESAERTAAS